MKKEQNQKYETQQFVYKLEKLSKRGWDTNPRVVSLDKDYLSYYRKVPAQFTLNELTGLSKPKCQLKLARIKNIAIVNEESASKNKKLKGNSFKIIKITYMKDGVLKNGDADSDDEKIKSARSKNKKGKKNKRSKSKEKNAKITNEWHFICSDDNERN